MNNDKNVFVFLNKIINIFGYIRSLCVVVSEIFLEFFVLPVRFSYFSKMNKTTKGFATCREKALCLFEL